MNDYHAPQIIDKRSVNGRLNDWASVDHFGGSDAEIKHGVEPVRSTDYEAPAISEQRDLDGHLGGLRSVGDL